MSNSARLKNCNKVGGTECRYWNFEHVVVIWRCTFGINFIIFGNIGLLHGVIWSWAWDFFLCRKTFSFNFRCSQHTHCIHFMCFYYLFFQEILLFNEILHFWAFWMVHLDDNNVQKWTRAKYWHFLGAYSVANNF